MSCPTGKTIAVIGGGLAGLAAGCALTDAGFRVTLFERRPYLGGRASSYEHSGTGEVVDNCQHVLLGCCTGLLDFYRRIGAEHLVRWYDRLNFIEPGGRTSVIGASWLPAPFHTAPSFLGASSLGVADKLAIMRALLVLMRGVPSDNGKPFLSWLQAHGQTSRALERFWKVVLVSALNEDLDRIATPLAAMVIRDSFLKSARGGAMGVPRVPLSELYSKAGDYIIAHGGRVELRTAVEDVDPVGESTVGASGALWASRAGVKLCANRGPRMFDYTVCAVPFDALAKILPRAPQSAALHSLLAKFETSPITGIHLWFDREITTVDHAVLLDRTIQWMFHKSRILDRKLSSGTQTATIEDLTPLTGGHAERSEASAFGEKKTDPSIAQNAARTQDDPQESGMGDEAAGGRGSYVELVISASKTLLDKPRQEIIDLGVRELAEFFPEVKQAKLVKATVVKEVHATYSPLPGSEANRPAAETCWDRIFLAGDWTATGWPATMEGAVRSGYRAAEALCRACGNSQQFMPADLPASGFMRWLEPRS
jgi:squalene-associated FAD-dependent desaturase